VKKIQKVKINVVYDDLDGVEADFMKSFGFAALIEIEDKKLLFDVGTKEDVLKKNLSALKILPSQIDAVILSHNHYDHANGLSAIMRDNPNIPVYVHKYWNNPVRHIGNPIPPKNIRMIQEGRKLEELGAHIYVTNCYQSQDYGGIYEQACYLEAEDSFILICGCSHPGLNVFLDDRPNLGISPTKPLHIMGGFHSFKFDDDRVNQLNPYVKSIIIFHCTKNIKTFQSQFHEKCSIGSVGTSYNF
jgi:7,8-dihydropterin-6-yl-methyl-4-(beta-D-ribofuranosyl)aminobenzene 5'-phosphate synthase